MIRHISLIPIGNIFKRTFIQNLIVIRNHLKPLMIVLNLNDDENRKMSFYTDFVFGKLLICQ